MADYGVGSWPRRRARIDPAATAFRQQDRQVSYSTLASRVEGLARGMRGQGVKPGDRVAYLGPNDINTFEVFFATGCLGAIFVPLNTRLTASELTVLVNDCAPTMLFHGPTQLDISTDLPNIAAEVSVDPATSSAYEDLIKEGSTDASTVPLAEVRLEDDAVILYTSGTTGRPKGAVLTHANLTFNVMNQLAHTDILGSDTAMCMAPLFHATGLGQVSLPTLFKGGCVVVAPRFDAAAALAAIPSLKIASFSAVPTMLQMLCDHPDFERTDLSSLRYVIYGGSMVAERVALAWQRRGVVLLQGYGMTEAAPGVYMATAAGAKQRPISIGVPHFFTDVSLDPVDKENSGRGELLVRGLNVFRGYWQRATDTELAMAGGWFHSGDILTVDDDGWAYVVDRAKDMIISGGENIYPAEVEAQLNKLDGVLDSAVVAVPDEKWGEVGLAFLVVSADATRWTESGIRQALDGRLAAYKIPKHVRFVDDLPKTATGKIRKEILRAATTEGNQHDHAPRHP